MMTSDVRKFREGACRGRPCGRGESHLPNHGINILPVTIARMARKSFGGKARPTLRGTLRRPRFHIRTGGWIPDFGEHRTNTREGIRQTAARGSDRRRYQRPAAGITLVAILEGLRLPGEERGKQEGMMGAVTVYRLNEAGLPDIAPDTLSGPSWSCGYPNGGTTTRTCCGWHGNSSPWIRRTPSTSSSAVGQGRDPYLAGGPGTVWRGRFRTRNLGRSER